MKAFYLKSYCHNCGFCDESGDIGLEYVVCPFCNEAMEVVLRYYEK